MAIEGNSPLDQKGHGRESDGRTHNDAAIRNSLDIAKDLSYHIIISEMLWGFPIVFQLRGLLLWSVKATFFLERWTSPSIMELAFKKLKLSENKITTSLYIRALKSAFRK